VRVWFCVVEFVDRGEGEVVGRVCPQGVTYDGRGCWLTLRTRGKAAVGARGEVGTVVRDKDRKEEFNDSVRKATANIPTRGPARSDHIVVELRNLDKKVAG
jgi:hypothetical protein